jgi:hypothetical protein
MCTHATRYAGQTSHSLLEQCRKFLRYLKLATGSLVGSVPLMRYVTVLAIWCRWPDTPGWHAKAQEFVHGPDVVCYTCCHGGGALHPPLE